MFTYFQLSNSKTLAFDRIQHEMLAHEEKLYDELDKLSRIPYLDTKITIETQFRDKLLALRKQLKEVKTFHFNGPRKNIQKAAADYIALSSQQLDLYCQYLLEYNPMLEDLMKKKKRL